MRRVLPFSLSCAALLLNSWGAQAAKPADLRARIDAEAAKVAPAMIADRHTIHQNPELGYEEVATSKLVADALRAAGLEVQTGIAKTGVVAILKGGKPGPVIAVRADMDALPVTEDTDLPFKSTKRETYLGKDVGVAHACGHDIHTTSLLGTALVLASMRADLPGTVKFIFQPDEEGPPPGEITGALAMFRAGVLDNPKPEAIFALHTFNEVGDGVVAEVGKVGVTSGPAYAAVDQFVITIKGKQSHGAYPHLGIDPIVIGAQAVEALQTIRSRNLPATEPSVVTVGIFRGGERFNIIPAEVHLEGTVRTYSVAARDTVQRRMREILEGVTHAGGGTFELEYNENAPVTVNDPKLFDRMRSSLDRTLGKVNVVDSPATMGGEDYGYFSREVPGFYYRLGIVKPGTTTTGLHTPTYRPDDSAILVGIRSMSNLLVDYLQGN
ncbi:MAG: amidohydrolase [Acidobacteriota bacterium]